MTEVTISSEFRNRIKASVFAIIVFIFVYILLFIAGLVCTAALAYSGFLLAVNAPHLITIILAFGMALTGIVIMYFLIKFLFKVEKLDQSHLIEVTKKDQPKLFEMIEKVLQSTNSKYPKKVFLSPDVNAMVSFNSSFWSMIFPTKKNLIIGMGLINSTTVSELEGILAHEFGHFNQESMRLGSFVYNVNKIIHNMLYDNDGMNSTLGNIASQSIFLYLPLMLGFYIIQAFQWVLLKVYNFVNKRYMAVSREMEFHADEIATLHAGQENMKRSLLRLELATSAFETARSTYADLISESKKLTNIYPLHTHILGFIAKNQQLQVEGQFPIVTLQDYSNQNNSKIRIDNQWASHPSIPDRISKIDSHNKVEVKFDKNPSVSIISNQEKYQEKLTDKILSTIQKADELETINLDEAKSEYLKQYNAYKYPKKLQELYSVIDPILNKEKLNDNSRKLSEIIQKEEVTKISEFNVLQQDLSMLEEINSPFVDLKTFDYDGTKYKKKQAEDLIKQLTNKKEQLEKELQELDNEILSSIFQTTNEIEQSEIENQFSSYQEFFSFFKACEETFKNIMEKSSFLSESLQPNEINQRESHFKIQEKPFKESISKILEMDNLKIVATPQLIVEMKKYVDTNRDLFNGVSYNNSVIERLGLVTQFYPDVVYKLLVLEKKKLLDVLNQHLD